MLVIRAAAAAFCVGALPPTVGIAAPGSADLARCAAVTAPDARLACYDALAGRAAPVASAGSSVPTTAPAPPPDDPRSFGLTPAQQHVAPTGPESIQARIAKVAPAGPGRASLLLDNGQTWLLSEDDGRLSPGDAVTIKRGALASFTLFAPSRLTYKVRRLQ
jgi:hypothetical protein